jgi:hypothetical protein
MTKSKPRSQPTKSDDISVSECNKIRQGKPSFVGASPEEMAKVLHHMELLQDLGVCS